MQVTAKCPGEYMAFDVRQVTAVNHGDVTMMTDDFLRTIAKVCGLENGDLIFLHSFFDTFIFDRSGTVAAPR